MNGNEDHYNIYIWTKTTKPQDQYMKWRESKNNENIKKNTYYILASFIEINFQVTKFRNSSSVLTSIFIKKANLSVIRCYTCVDVWLIGRSCIAFSKESAAHSAFDVDILDIVSSSAHPWMLILLVKVIWLNLTPSVLYKNWSLNCLKKVSAELKVW